MLTCIHTRDQHDWYLKRDKIVVVARYNARDRRINILLNYANLVLRDILCWYTHTYTHTQMRHPSIVKPHLCLLEWLMHTHTHTWPAYFIHERTFILDDVRKVDVCREDEQNREKNGNYWTRDCSRKIYSKNNINLYNTVIFRVFVCMCVPMPEKNQRKITENLTYMNVIFGSIV